MGFVCRLPVKDHVATLLPTEPLGVGIVEILDVPLQVVFTGTCLLNAFFPTKAACERALLLGCWC